MKKKFIATLLALSMVGALCACGSSSDTSSTTAAETTTASEETTTASEETTAASEETTTASDTASTADIKVGIAAPAVDHGWVAGVAYYAEQYCEENGLEYQVSTSSDAAEMTAGLQDLIAWGATLIVCYPQWTGMETAIQEVVDAGIPVVNFDIDIDVEGIYKVAGDNHGMGYECARYITDKVGDAATIAVMDNPNSGSVAELRKQGFYDYLDEIGYDQSNIFEATITSWARDEGLSVMADVLEANPEIDAVFSMDDEASMGFIQAITEAGRTDIHAITGGGGSQEYFGMIADEQYADLGLCTALYSPSMIQDAIELGIQVLNGEDVEQSVTIPTTIVDADNVADYLEPDNTVY